MDLSFVIVNLNTRELLLSCIGSIYGTVPPLSFEIRVVDNGSTDQSVEAVRQAFPGVSCVENGPNLGFAKANNQAIRQAAGRYVVLLNTDTVLTPLALRRIVDFMDQNPDVAICGGQLLNGDGSLQNSIANYPSLATELLNKPLLRMLMPERFPGKNRSFDKPLEVESIIGACMVVAKAAIEKVGLLNEDYFFYLEETDWCLSMKKGGWRVFFHPQAQIYHLQGQTAKKNVVPARIEYWISRYIFFRKHTTPFALMVLRAGLLAKLCGSLALQLPAAPFSNKVRGRFRTNSALLVWHLCGCPVSSGLRPGLREMKADLS